MQEPLLLYVCNDAFMQGETDVYLFLLVLFSLNTAILSVRGFIKL